MDTTVDDLQQRAIEFARHQDFGPRALEANLELTRVSPHNEGAWTRLARCYVERGQLDEAMHAVDAVLQVNPQNTIARNMQADIARRRNTSALTSAPPRARTRSTTPKTERTARPQRQAPLRLGGGFGRPQFAALAQLPPAQAIETLAPSIEPLLETLNDRPFAARAVESRNRNAQSAIKLFRPSSVFAGAPGHIYAHQYGGRWEPQFNIGWGQVWIRAGLGFNFSLEADAPDAERIVGQERALRYFERFQRLVNSEWRQLLVDWMGLNSGFVQLGSVEPERALLPRDAVARLIAINNPQELGWVFVGRWLFGDRPDDVELMADGPKLARWCEQAFTSLLPLWSSIYRG
jgi:hypothetical protein